MPARRMITVDGNEGVAAVAHRLSEVIAIYPITPSSSMGELSDAWSAYGKTNIWGRVPEVVEMQSEGGAAGAVHGALQAGALSTTFTASQGLLLMIPNMYKIAGELTPFVMHVAARTLATHALSIFGDHSDVMACRQTGFAMLCSGSVQEAQDMAAIAHCATLNARLPFLHFFDGFRTSHEVAKIEELTNEDLLAMIDEARILEHRARSLSPDRPEIRGTAQNPDVFFQAREAANLFHDAVPGHVRDAMERFEKLTGRSYKLFDYAGHPEAERVIVLMGSGAEAVHELVDWMVARGEKVGVLKVRLFRPFATADFLHALPRTVKSLAILDRTKEPGATGEPLYQDIVTALRETEENGNSPFAARPKVVGGRYGLSSKEFGPPAIKAVFDNLAADKPRNHFTVGIVDDVTHLSLPMDNDFDIEPDDVVRAVFYGLGADGTVGANKNSIKIIGEETPNFAQGYFVYDSKKSGASTISHLRFGPRPIRSTYLVRQAGFVACHQPEFVEKFDVLETAKPGATFLLNTPWDADKVWDTLPRELQEGLVERRMKLFVIDAVKVAGEAGLGGRINTVMQVCFFALSGVLPREQAIEEIKHAIDKTYSKRGAEIVKRNFAAVDAALAHMHEVKVSDRGLTERRRPSIVSENAPEFVKRVEAVMLAGKGDLLPVSAFPIDGTWPVGTTQWEKRNIALEIPVWDPKICIQCNYCAFVCPHAAIRTKAYPNAAAASLADDFLRVPFKSNDIPDHAYTVQVAPEDCTGCGLCVAACPAKDKTNPRHKAIDMAPQRPIRELEAKRFETFLSLPEIDRSAIKRMDVKGSQLLQPLFEFSGACTGCGETPYVKLLSQLFGDRTVVANATGCSSIYGGNLPTTPWAANKDGRGTAWANSLFEDNAEFGLGLRLALDSRKRTAEQLLKRLAPEIGEELANALLAADMSGEAGIAEQRLRVKALRDKLTSLKTPDARALESVVDDLVKKSVWIVGGDGWAYDIGFGGLDHVLASGRNVNILVLDTEVYSNTGGQASKATPMGASAKFAEAGKDIGKKDLGLLAMTYGNAYVARIAMGGKMQQTVQAFLEAEAFDGPSLIIAYSHCIAHGYDMVHGLDQQKLACETGVWPLFRFDPRRVAAGLPPLLVDSPPRKGKVADYMRNESRFRMVERMDPERFKRFAKASEKAAAQRFSVYEQLAGLKVALPPAEPEAAPVVAGNKE